MCYHIITFVLEVLKLVLTLKIIHVILSIALVVVVLLQSGKQAGLSGSISGGAETFFGKNKARTMDAMLSRITTAVAILFVITSFVLSLVL